MSGQKRLVHEFAAALEDLVGFYQTRDRSTVCYYDISVSECHALSAIERKGPLALKAVVELLQLDKSTTSRIVASLVKRGYVRRESDGRDARLLRLSITAKGREVHGRVRLDLQEEYARLLCRQPAAFARRIPQFLREVTREARRRHGLGD